jgi:hypothetical protein
MTKSNKSKAIAFAANNSNPARAKKSCGVRMAQKLSKGAAGPVKVYTADERAAWAKDRGYTCV